MRFLCLIICLSSGFLFAQRNLSDSSITAVIFSPNYSFNLTGGDLNERFGYNSRVGLDIGIKFKNNLTIDLDGGFIFGNQLKDTAMFDKFQNSFGTITSLNGNPADVLFAMRGMSAHLNFGYVFHRIGGINPNSGLWVNVGLGYMMHKIHIESLYDPVPQLEGEYQKGYDKLTMGFSSREFIGYMFHGNNQFLNFFAGFEFTQGFTKNIRSYNFDSEGPDNEQKFDMLYSIKVGWLIPMYKRTPKEYYFD